MPNRLLKILAALFGWKHVTIPRGRPIAGVVIGIGNDEEKYRGTRHNIGFDVADLLIDRSSGTESIATSHSRAVLCKMDDRTELVVAKPTTYVNRSGDAVAELLSALKLTPESCLVVVDDINLPLGTIRSRGKGSDGGHNGLKSIIGEIGRGFPRVRIGVGPVPRDMPLVEFVLGSFAPEELPLKRRIIEVSAEAVAHWVKKGIEPTMSRYNITIDLADEGDGASGAHA